MEFIPVTNDGSRIVTVDVGSDRGEYNFHTFWNDFNSAWNLSISTNDDVPLVSGIMLTTGIDLLAFDPSLHDTFGQLRVASFTDSNNRNKEDLGLNAALVLFEIGEYEELFPSDAALPVLIVEIGEVIP